MIRTVVEHDPEIHHGESGKVSARGGVFDSLFDRGNVVFRDGTAEDVIHEFKSCAPHERFHLDLAVSVLAVPAGLLFVAALHISFPANGLAIGNFGRFQVHFRVVPLLHLGDYDFNMLLPRARNQKLLGLRIAEEAQHGVFLHQLVNAGAQLVFIGTALGLDGKGNRRLGQGDFGILNRSRLVAQRVAGQGVPQLGYYADIPGVQLGHGHRRLALQDRDVGQLLLRVASKVLYQGVVFQHAGENFEIRNPPREGIGNRLEDIERQRFGIGHLPLWRFAVARRSFSLHRLPLGRRGRVIDNEIHHPVGADVSET